MQSNPGSQSPATPGYKIYGSVYNQYQQPLVKVWVRAFDKDIRSEQALGETITDASGNFEIQYSTEQFSSGDKQAADVVIRVFDSKNSFLKESDVYYNAPATLKVDINLSGKNYAGPSLFEQFTENIDPYITGITTAELTESDKQQDLSFLTNKTGLSIDDVEDFAMASRFAISAKVPASAWFGMLQKGMPGNIIVGFVRNIPNGNYETKLTAIWSGLMNSNIDSLMNALQLSIDDNTIPYAVTEQLPAIRKELLSQIQNYSGPDKKDKDPSPLIQKLQLAGLSQDEIQSFTDLFSSNISATEDFFKAISSNQQFSDKATALQSVFQAGQLTGENMGLTSYLTQTVKSAGSNDLKSFAANNAADWEKIIRQQNIQPPLTTRGSTIDEKIRTYATQLETNFTKQFPTAAFSARLSNDTSVTMPANDALVSFFQKNTDFDLLQTRIGQYTKERPGIIPKEQVIAVSDQLRRIQRVFKLSPDYETTKTLLADNIHSAQQVYDMGPEQFVNTYGDKLGSSQSKKIYQKAKQVHAQAVALVGHLKSLSDSSALQVFPDYGQIIQQSGMSAEIPNLINLFGNNDSCMCDDCNSVYGAAAYLTDMLHYLDMRSSSLNCSPGKNASVKDILLRRRPDIGDIDLDCENTNTEIPYIDIACELMEDFIAEPAVAIVSSFLPSLVAGIIPASLLTEIIQQFNTAGQTRVAELLTSNAKISELYAVTRLQDNNICITENHWVIRDERVVLKATDLGASGVQIKLLHQTLLSSNEVSANPEYINVNTYENFLKTAKRPFTLPFDLFETEAELYLGKAGFTKSGLINTFKKNHVTTPDPTPDDLAVAYALLGVNEPEQNLIFQADTANQSLYWGTAASGTSIKVDTFEQLTSLTYEQIIDLLSLHFINPTGDTLIEHDDLSCDTDKQHLTNLTSAKFDSIHRFLRLWRKTSVSMRELDAIIMSPSLGNGNINPALAWQLQHFPQLSNSLSLVPFQLLAFYQDLDTNQPDSIYFQLFQNRSVTNPLNTDFGLPAVTAGTAPLSAADLVTIQAALLIEAGDLQILLGVLQVKLGLAHISDITLSMQNLSFIYRYSTLAKTLSISISDLLIAFDLININPVYDLVTICSPVITDQFLHKYSILKRSGFSVPELNYLLRHQDPANTFSPATSTIETNLTELQTGLLQIQVNTEPLPDSKGVLLSKWLSDPILKWDGRFLAKLLDILNTSDDAAYVKKIDDNHFFLLNLRIAYQASSNSTYLNTMPVDLSNLPSGTPDNIATQLKYDNTQKQLIWTGIMTINDQTALNALPGVTPAFTAAVSLLFSSAQLSSSANTNLLLVNDPGDFNILKSLVDGVSSGNSTISIANRFGFFLQAVSIPYRLLLQQNFTISKLTKWFKSDQRAIAVLVKNNPALFTYLLDNGFINKNSLLNIANYPNQFRQYLLASKISFFINKLKLTAEELQFLLPNASAVNSLDLLSLPLDMISGPVTSFNSFENLINILRFEQYHLSVITDPVSNNTISVFTILNDGIINAPVTTIENDLNLLTGWSLTELDKLIHLPNYLQAIFPGDAKDINVLLQLHDCFNTINSLGVSADDLVQWYNPSLGFDDAVKIKQTLKKKYNDADWLSLTQPLQDQLREKKRDVLIAWLLTNPGTMSWQTDTDLYGYFLLDVEMCACQPTSRIVQATNSVQLFVQRCFLALEDYISVNIAVDSSWNQWQWMKYYRLWQANREVFLWPENWIEPDLLPKEIKSSFFQDLQNDLQQNEVTEVTAENAFQNYLEKLDGVARLEVKGMWYDDPTRTLYVFARTYGGDPKIYYFRRLIENRRWTPWQKVDLDIKSDFIVPVVFNNRIYLFWAVISEQTDQPSDSGLTIPNYDHNLGGYPPPERPKKYWQIQLAFSEYRNNKWSPKKVSNSDYTGMIDKLYEDYFPDKSNFLFTPLDLPHLNFSNLYDASGKPKDPKTFIPLLLQDIEKSLLQNGFLIINCYYQQKSYYQYLGSFELDPCRGYPVFIWDNVAIHPVLFDNSSLYNMLDREYAGGSVLSLSHNAIQNKTPDSFNNLLPSQMGFIDRLINIFYQLAHQQKNSQTAVGKPETMSVSLGTFMPYFFEDKHRTYFVEPEFSNDGAFEMFYADLEDLFLAYAEQNQASIQQILSTIPKGSKLSLMYHYYNFYHPLVCFFIRQLFTGGIDGLMSRTTQMKNDIAYDPNTEKFSFGQYYSPTALVYNDSLQPVTYPNGVVDATPGYPKDDVDFSMNSGYGLYNWELFFHAPLLIGEQLSLNQQYEDADRWFRYIFNPADTSSYPSPDKYWNTKPFFINVNDKYNQQQIGNIMLGINSGDQALVKDVTDWANNPFQPHYIAEYRTVAYQLTTVMKYLDHLIRWGDYYFTQDTMESVNEATQLYMLASQILGPKPQIIPPPYERPVDNYYQLESKLDAFSNAMVDIENLLPLQKIAGYNGIVPNQGLPALQTLYFCIPMNQKLVGPTGYWNTISDRLYKIRHCLNIQGTFAPLALFAPPIDPGMLVRATAMGINLGSILNDMNSPVPYYRFAVMLQKATDLCNEVKSLGSMLLSALEKADAESMVLLRSGHEISVLKAISLVKKKQIDDAQSNLDNLNAQKQLTTIRRDYYQNLVNNGWNAWEKTAFALNTISTALDDSIVASYILAGVLRSVPGFLAGASGFGGSPVASMKFEGGQFGEAAKIGAEAQSHISVALDKSAALASATASYQRRGEDWQFQLNMANQELAQTDILIAGAQIKLEIANQDLENQQLQISNAQAEDDFMHSKYTNEELYTWMITQISATYFQSYQQAFGVAKQAEQCFRYELGLSDSAYINFGYWDSLKKGLLSGEQLMSDIKRMEISYYNQNQREYELVKHIALADLDPLALLSLKTNGDCWINIPEELFDMDYPGHFMRRIKTFAMSMPCILGRYTMVSSKLTMSKNSVRTNSSSTGAAGYPRKTTNGIPSDDARFRDSIGVVQSIATSTAQQDDGLFELNFHDERYLPFEYAGAISLWHLEMTAAIQPFDYNTISDVILHLRYTSRDGGESLRTDAIASLTSRINQILVSTKDQGLMRSLSARQDFPTSWYQFLHPANVADPQVLTMNLTMDRFPYAVQQKTIQISSIELAGYSTVSSIKLSLSPVPTGPNPVILTADGKYGNLLHVSESYPSGTTVPVNLVITNSSGTPFTAETLSDLVVVIHYTI